MIVLPSGELRWLSATGKEYCDENGHVVRVVGNNKQHEPIDDEQKDSDERSRRSPDLTQFADGLMPEAVALPVGPSLTAIHNSLGSMA